MKHQIVCVFREGYQYKDDSNFWTINWYRPEIIKFKSIKQLKEFIKFHLSKSTDESNNYNFDLIYYGKEVIENKEISL